MRQIPAARLAAIGWIVLALVVMGVAAWEWRMRSLGLHAGDLDDGASHWIEERRRIEAGDHDGVVILGSSRILFDTDLDVWQELTGRRPVQLALPGTSPRQFLESFAAESGFGGLVVVGITPGVFFSEFTTAFPEYAEMNAAWREESPSKRFGHRVALELSRHLAFLDDQYRLGTLIERVDIPDRPGVRRPFMDVWKLSESFDDRQYRLWPRLEADARLREHAKAVWMAGPAGGRAAPAPEFLTKINAEVSRDVERIRARGGEVVFIRPPSGGSLYEREQQNVPRDLTWNRLLDETGAFGIHFEDHPEMQGLDIPEMSHLSRASAPRFTRAYVGVLMREFPWLAAGSEGVRTP